MSEYEYPLSTGRSNILGTEAFRNLLGESLDKAKEQIIILSAFVKIKGVNWLVDNISKENIGCTILSKWDHSDIAQGASDLECYEICKKNNWQFKILNDLHAKLMLVDNKSLFIGSPNLTGKGMSLVPVSNKEMGIKVSATDSDKKIISSLLEEAILVNEDIYSKLMEWKKNLPEIKKTVYPEFPETLKTKLRENLDKIWVHNFPWSKPEDLLNLRENNENINHDLELFGLSEESLTKETLRTGLENSKIHRWLKFQIKRQENEEIYFGALSSIIHNSLIDDPKPYRQDVKKLQSNLYSFIKSLMPDHYIIDVPFEKSERIRIKS